MTMNEVIQELAAMQIGASHTNIAAFSSHMADLPQNAIADNERVRYAG